MHIRISLWTHDLNNMHITIVSNVSSTTALYRSETAMKQNDISTW